MTKNFPPRLWVQLALGAVVLAFTACGGSDGAAPPPAASATVGPAGGTLDGPNGAQLVIPANALAAPAAITLAQSADALPALPGGTTPLGATFTATPHGTSFAVPVTIRLPFDPALVEAGFTPSLLKTTAGQLGWAAVPGATVSGNMLQAQITSFSGMVVVILAPPLIYSQPARQTTVTAPATATFSVGARGPTRAGVLSYVWKKNGTVIAGALGPTYTTGPTSAADNASVFTVEVSNAFGTVTSDGAILTVSGALPAAQHVSAGQGYSLAVSSAGVLYSWGSDLSGVLGNGPASEANVLSPAAISTVSPLRSVEAGAAAAVAAGDPNSSVAPGALYLWGYLGSLACAFGTTYDRPLTSTGANGRQSSGVTAVSAGANHVLVMQGGVVLSMGCNDEGQLGRSGANYYVPDTVVGLPGGMIAIAACQFFSLAVDGNGDVWSWGRGALGDGRAYGAVSRPLPAKVAGIARVKAINCSDDHVLALLESGAVLAWGHNESGQLGDGTTVDRLVPTPTLLTSGIASISAGHGLSMAIRTDDKLLAWGVNDHGQLGLGSAGASVRPAPDLVPGLSNVAEVSVGTAGYHVLALLRDGTVHAWGDNTEGQLGDGTRTSRYVPTPIPRFNLN